jgi:hypothetical protein
MDSKTINPWQAKAIYEALFPGVNHLIRLRQRMEATGFPPDDQLYRKVRAAHDALNDLRLTAHYVSCSGTGAPSSFGSARAD